VSPGTALAGVSTIDEATAEGADVATTARDALIAADDDSSESAKPTGTIRAATIAARRTTR
jgi:hypothetical protein